MRGEVAMTAALLADRPIPALALLLALLLLAGAAAVALRAADED